MLHKRPCGVRVWCQEQGGTTLRQVKTLSSRSSCLRAANTHCSRLKDGTAIRAARTRTPESAPVQGHTAAALLAPQRVAHHRDGLHLRVGGALGSHCRRRGAWGGWGCRQQKVGNPERQSRLVIGRSKFGAWSSFGQSSVKAQNGIPIEPTQNLRVSQTAHLAP